MKFLIYFLLIAFLICSCTGEERTSYPADVVISGHISNFENADGHNFVSVIYFDIVENRKEITQFIDDSGNFKIVIDNLYRSKEIWFGYGQILTFFISPGDSLYFEIDSKSLEGYKGTGNHYSYYKVSGASETINSEIAAFLTLLQDSSFSADYWNERSSAPVKLSPIEYLAFSETDFKKRDAVAKTFISKYSPSEEFKEWVEYDLKFKQWKDLMRYIWLHPLENQLDIGEFEKNMPKSYFNFLDNWDKENKGCLQSIAYQNFLQEYSNHNDRLFDSVNYKRVLLVLL